MAKIEFEAFVEDVISGQTGAFGLKTAEKHDKRDEQNNWKTVARTFRTVKASREAQIDFNQFPKDSRVRVFGNEKTEVREYQGKNYYDLVVWAERIEPIERSQNASNGAQEAAATDSWATAALGAEVPPEDPWAGAEYPDYGDGSTPF